LAALRHEGIELAVGKSEAGQRFELPTDRVGDLVIIFNPAQGAWHDAEASRPVRSHRTATLSWRTNRADRPMIVNRQVDWPDGQTRNFDIFHIALNHVRVSLDKASTAS
jgi:phosphonoacetate hydrolase